MKWKLKRIPVFTMKIVYHSGHVHMFDVTEFKIKGGTWSWTAFDANNNRPIHFGEIDRIEAVWQVSVRHVWRFVE